MCRDAQQHPSVGNANHDSEAAPHTQEKAYRKTKITSADEDMKTGTSAAVDRKSTVQPRQEAVWRHHKRLKTELLYNPASHCWVCTKELKAGSPRDTAQPFSQQHSSR